MSEWNWSAERRTAIGDVANQSLEYVAERLLESRKRVFDAEHKGQQLQAELDALKAAHAWINASERLPEDGAKVLAIVREVMILVYDTDTEFPGAPWRTENADIVFNKSSIVKWMPIPGDT
jgi:hypothetical protein